MSGKERIRSTGPEAYVYCCNKTLRAGESCDHLLMTGDGDRWHLSVLRDIPEIDFAVRWPDSDRPESKGQYGPSYWAISTKESTDVR